MTQDLLCMCQELWDTSRLPLDNLFRRIDYFKTIISHHWDVIINTHNIHLTWKEPHFVIECLFWNTAFQSSLINDGGLLSSFFPCLSSLLTGRSSLYLSRSVSVCVRWWLPGLFILWIFQWFMCSDSSSLVELFFLCGAETIICFFSWLQVRPDVLTFCVFFSRQSFQKCTLPSPGDFRNRLWSLGNPEKY